MIEYWKNIEQSESGPHAELAERVLENIGNYPEFSEGAIDPKFLEDKVDIIDVLLSDVFSPATKKNDARAITIPYHNILINPSVKLESILRKTGASFNIRIHDISDHQLYVMCCCLILNKIYHTDFDISKPLFYAIPTTENVTKYYRIVYNDEYFDLRPTENAVEISTEDIELLRDNFDNLDLWMEKFPPDSWLLNGFATIFLFDATIENAVSVLKERLLTEKSDNMTDDLTSLFRSIFDVGDLLIGFTAFSAIDGMFRVANFDQTVHSYLLDEEREIDPFEAMDKDVIEKLIKKKGYFAVSDTLKYKNENPGCILSLNFSKQNIKSFILAPVVKNNVLIGVFEVVSFRRAELHSINANKLDIVMPFLTDTIDRLFIDFHIRIQAFIQTEYTSIHPSVYWKFQEEASNYLHHNLTNKDYVLKEIIFSDVYPLYGQIDIKGSSLVRNNSTLLDIQKQASALFNLLEVLNPHNPETIKFHKDKVAFFQTEITSSFKADTEQSFKNFLDVQLHPFLNTLAGLEDAKKLIDEYFFYCKKDDGDFHINRRKYDATVTAINKKMASMLDGAQNEAQKIFPHYYERFKTDGVEHNLYIGASLVPKQKFDYSHLHDLRIWQLQALCEMEFDHDLQKLGYPIPLDVTSLILVFSSQISIRFRIDEKHFDVDGSYNARFEMVKKRIDKACVKGTNKRITEVGKITVVYSNKGEESDYLTYIKFFQSKQILDQSIEIYDVEDLQGITGLKAIQVKILHSRKNVLSTRYSYNDILSELATHVLH